MEQLGISQAHGETLDEAPQLMVETEQVHVRKWVLSSENGVGVGRMHAARQASVRHQMLQGAWSSAADLVVALRMSDIHRAKAMHRSINNAKPTF